jgi:hypothetical protein
MNQRTVLIKVDVVKHLTNLSIDEIYSRAGGGSLFGGFTWVWNVAVDPEGEIRDLRFWAREIIMPETTRRLSLDQVIKSILPAKRTQYPSGEVCETVLSIRRPTLKELRRELNGQLAANSSFFPREGLEKFLRRRWLNAHRAETIGRAA